MRDRFQRPREVARCLLAVIDVGCESLRRKDSAFAVQSHALQWQNSSDERIFVVCGKARLDRPNLGLMAQ